MKTHIVHIMFLVVILAIGSWTFLSMAGNPDFMRLTGITMAGAYVAWGIIHHAVSGNLRVRVVIEYVLVAAIALVFLFAVLA
jgi:hypothetical protein